MTVDENILAGSPEDALVGTVFAGSYEILQVLGRGGMSVVYKARYLPLDELVALKVMQAHMIATAATYRRLQQEARTAGSLDHENIVRIRRMHISEDGFPFLVADLVKGQTIQSIVRHEGPFEETRFRKVFSQVLDALEHAHSRGIIHRDIKPSNIMLTCEDGIPDRVKIVDFGIATMLGDSASVTQGVTQSASGHIFGSPAYMSPEQCSGKRTDARTDIYSLACVMYEVLTGVPAFGGDTALDTMYHQVHDLPPSFAEAAPEKQIPSQLESAIFAALRKDRGDRPQSILQFRAMLAGSEPVPKVSRLKRLRRLLKIALLPLGLAAIGAMVVLLIGHLQALENAATTVDGAAGPTDPTASIQFPSTVSGCLRDAENVYLFRRPDDWKNIRALQYFEHANNMLTSREATARFEDRFQTKLRLGKCLTALGKYARAKAFYLEALEMAQEAHSQADQFAAFSSLIDNLTKASAGQPENRRQELLKEALGYSLRQVALTEVMAKESAADSIVNRNSHRLAGCAWLAAASCYQNVGTGNPKEAMEALKQSCKHAALCEDTLLKMQANRALATALLQTDQRQDMQKCLSRWQALENTMPADAVNSFEERSQGWQVRGWLLHRLGKHTEANLAHLKAVEFAHAESGEVDLYRPQDEADRRIHYVLSFYELNDLKSGDEQLQVLTQFCRSNHIESFLLNQRALIENYRNKAISRLSVQHKKAKSSGVEK